ncbi:ABC transporter permease [Flavihumibacter petaseus]|uniref:Putative ABC transporter permease protein n=1 Tax=Flavihumibacter petaseus NBRC 106054 TaxID=1220578 RepID=A0A0E9N4V9_9BACT|nr:ABC transporter permease [Flavihumibacter petaseus]GAO44380.1 putative ABC transporter permease protein [Flavihumibacter petaseus NBRC 106054]
MFRNYFVITLRNLWRNKAYSAINIVGLSIGLACCMLIVLYTKDEWSFDRFHQKQERLFRITNTSKSPDGNVRKSGITGLMQGPSFKEAVPEIEAFLRYSSTGFTIRQGTQVFDQGATFVDDNFFEVFSFPLLKGNPATVLKEPRSVVLTPSLAKKYFGDKDPLGQTLELKNGENFEPFTVTGIAGESPSNSSIQLGMLIPFKIRLGDQPLLNEEWLNYSLNTFILLKPGTDFRKAAAKFDKIYQTLAAEEIKKAKEQYNWEDNVHFDLQPFADIHLNTEYGAANGLDHGSDPRYGYILSGIAFVLLIIACINFVNLTVARSLKRAREIGIRKVVGGQRRQLIAQFLGESFLLCLLSFVLAVFFVELALPLFNTLSNKALSFSYLFDAKLMLTYAGIFLLTGLLAGWYPALVLSGFNPVQTLYGKFRFTGKNYLSRGLLVFQFTLASLLIIATLVISQQFRYLTKVDLGYDDSRVGIVSTSRIEMAKWPMIREELLKIPEIESVTVDQGGYWGTVARVNGNKDMQFDFKIVDDNYLPLFRIPFVSGRNFNTRIASDTASGVIVNEAFVKEAGWKAPLNETVDFFYNNKKYKVIGVIKDYHSAALTQKINPQLFVANPTYSYSQVFIKFRKDKMAAGQPKLEAVCKNLFPFQPYSFVSMEEKNFNQYDSEARWQKIIGFSTILTILISCIGLFGLATLAAEKRTKEIGIRKVLGASVPVIVRTLSADFLKLVLLSAAIASPIAWWAMFRWLQNYPYRIELNWTVFALTTGLIGTLAFLTIAYQAIRAAMDNPVKSLKSE